MIFSLTNSRFNELMAPIYEIINFLLFDQNEGLFKVKGDTFNNENQEDYIRRRIYQKYVSIPILTQMIHQLHLWVQHHYLYISSFRWIL